MPYEIPNTPEGYAIAKASLNKPSIIVINEEKGKELFNVYCAICHVEAGDGKGNLAKERSLQECLIIKIGKLQKEVFPCNNLRN